MLHFLPLIFSPQELLPGRNSEPADTRNLKAAKSFTLQQGYHELRSMSRTGLKSKPLLSSMRWIKWAGLLSALLLIVSSFFPWVTIASRQIIISGMNAEGTTYGKPGFFHIIMAGIFIVLSFIPRVWAKRTNLLIVAMNFAWGVRNYFMLTRCEAGDCPEKQIALYLALFGTGMMMLAALFPDMKLPSEKTAKDPRLN